MLFDKLAKVKGLSLATTTLIKSSWSPETFRKMRHSWRLLWDFLAHDETTPEALLGDRASVIAANFKAHMLGATSGKGIEAIVTHTNVLLSTFDKDSAKLHHLIARAIHRMHPKKGRRYRTMWDIRELLNFVADRFGNNAELSNDDLLTKALALTMVFSACRMCELSRMTTTPEQVTETRLRVETNLKTALDTRDHIFFYPVADARICPHAALREWLGRLAPLPPLFTLPGTRAQLSTSMIASRLRALMTEAGIPDDYGPYSIKHAVVTFLFAQGASETQINEFGRWSTESRVPSAYYRVATARRDWLGYRLAEGATERRQSAAARAGPSNGVRLTAEEEDGEPSSDGSLEFGPQINAQ
jgi:integrase